MEIIYRYSVIDPDGTRRTVDYTADPLNGFNAVVSREPLVKAVVPAVAKIAAAPVAPAVVPARLAQPALISAPALAKYAAAPVFAAPARLAAPFSPFVPAPIPAARLAAYPSPLVL